MQLQILWDQALNRLLSLLQLPEQAFILEAFRNQILLIMHICLQCSLLSPQDFLHFRNSLILRLKLILVLFDYCQSITILLFEYLYLVLIKQALILAIHPHFLQFIVFLSTISQKPLTTFSIHLVCAFLSVLPWIDSWDRPYPGIMMITGSNWRPIVLIPLCALIEQRWVLQSSTTIFLLVFNRYTVILLRTAQIIVVQ